MHPFIETQKAWLRTDVPPFRAGDTRLLFCTNPLIWIPLFKLDLTVSYDNKRLRSRLQFRLFALLKPREDRKMVLLK